ncbi:hypothetical protein [Gilliamella sp. Fer4-1]|uniref:hypothetical protein n=1 Tax=Gilliamella sp. Fer4-1 TaxID=3120242 RepID=UPI00080DA621|nr:hypothetical protein [Gilliamella apicola]OCG56931.1 hypothetical protein A9G30_01960 [Gilliamella apicola]
MIDFTADIISYKSMANIQIGDNILSYLDEMYQYFDVNYQEHELHFSMGEMTRQSFYSLNDDTLTLTTTFDGDIIGIGCNQNYQGKYLNQYKNELYAGITMEELCSLSKFQKIVYGTLIVDNDYGLYFTLPSPYDEIADTLKDIPYDLKLNEIYVADNSSWQLKPQKKKKPKKRKIAKPYSYF